MKTRGPVLFLGAAALAAIVAVMGLRHAGALEEQELLAYDVLVSARARLLDIESPNVVVVGVTDEDILRWGWPLSDDTLAQAIERLLASGSPVVGVDLYRDIGHAPGSERLAELLRARPEVLAVAKLASEGHAAIPGPPALAETDRVAFTDFATDAGGVMRRALLYAESGGRTSESLGVRAARALLQREGIAPQPAPGVPGGLVLGRALLVPLEANDGGYANADAAGFQVLLDLRRGERGFPTMSLTDVLEGRATKELVAGRIALLGITAQSVKDTFATPLGRRSGEPRFGVVLHADASDQLVRMARGADPVPRALPAPWEIAWVAAAALAAVGAGWRARGRWEIVAASAAGLAAIALAGAVALIAAATWIPVASAAYAWAIAAFLASVLAARYEIAQRAVALGLFSRYVSREIAEELWKRREETLEASGRPRPRRLVATVLFSDIEGFTSLAERLAPDAMAGWLDEYLNAMSRTVAEAGGVVDKFIGDAVMAVFGVPLAHESEEDRRRDAVHAVECALAMRASLEHLNERWKAAGLPQIRTRIGIHTGELVAGSFGSAERLEYTVIGDTVNVASRLEAFDKSPVDEKELCRIHVSEDTFERLGGRFEARTIGEVALKGKAAPVRVRRLTGRRGESPARDSLGEHDESIRLARGGGAR